MTDRSSFSTPGLHGLSYIDDYWPEADAVRRELLEAPGWMPMTQADASGRHKVDAERQNGIMLTDFASLPAALAFGGHLHVHRHELCARVGIDAAGADGADIEMNGMAYGEGGWLSPHTDFVPSQQGRRLAAWMLYLTHKDDAEWTVGDGGAVRLTDGSNAETRLSPKFNRFAMFAVSPSSVHEIERVHRAGGWDRCRLALSGWFRGPNPVRHEARLFVRRDSARAEPAVAAAGPGEAALRRILQSQRRYQGRDESTIDADLFRLREDVARQRIDAPPGTVFSKFVPGPPGCIFVVDDQGTLLFFGPRDQYTPS